MPNPSNAVEMSKKLTFWRMGATAFEKIAGITELPDLPSSSRKSIDVTTVEDDHMQKIGDMTLDAGSITINLLDSSTNEGLATLKADIKESMPKLYRIKLVSGRQWDFWGVVTSVKPASKNGDVIRTAVTIDISGEPDEGTGV